MIIGSASLKHSLLFPWELSFFTILFLCFKYWTCFLGSSSHSKVPVLKGTFPFLHYYMGSHVIKHKMDVRLYSWFYKKKDRGPFRSSIATPARNEPLTHFPIELMGVNTSKLAVIVVIISKFIVVVVLVIPQSNSYNLLSSNDNIIMNIFLGSTFYGKKRIENVGYIRVNTNQYALYQFARYKPCYPPK